MKNKTISRRLLSLLLVCVLACSLLHTAFGAEEDDGLPEETTQSAADPLEDNLPQDTKENGADIKEMISNSEASTAEKSPQEDADISSEINMLSETGISPLAASVSASWTQMGQAQSKNGETFSFSFNGQSYTHSNIVLIGLNMNGDSKVSFDEAAYCIQPGTSLNISDFNYTGTEYIGVSDAWTELGKAKQSAIALTLLYGYPNGLIADVSAESAMQNKCNAIYHMATAIIVHEICIGYRSATAPYTCMDSSYFDFFYNTDMVWGNCLVYHIANGEVLDRDLLKEAYDYIANQLAKHGSTLSFASISQLSAPTHSMTQQSNSTYKVTLTDTNSVLADYTFPTISGVTFSVSGNTLTITAKDASSIPTTVIAPTRTVPSADKSAYVVWKANTSGQTLLSLKTKVNGDPVPACFKLEALEGSLTIKKTTNTGQNLSGWQFNIYSDSACKNLVEGPVTSGSDGTISVTLVPGTYYVKEIAKSDPFWVCDTSVKTVTVSAGATATVTFANSQYGKIKIVKSMNTDGSVEGWQFGIYRQEESGDPSGPLGTAISLKLVGTYTSAADGTILSDNLEPGTYVVQEIIPEDSLYYCETENPQTITVEAGETAQVFFTNALRPGKITVEKVNLQGEHLPGVKFLLEWSQDGTAWTPVVHLDNESVVLGGCTSEGLADGCLVTGADGFVTFEGLYPGIQYRLSEVEAPEGYVLLSDYAFQGELPAEDFTVTLTVVNASTFTLPMTGSNTLALMPIALALCMAVCVGALLYRRKK